LVLLCLLTRLVVAAIAERACLRGRLPWRYFLLLPLKDLVSFGLWLMSFLGDTVIWKGQRYRVAPDGRLENLKED
jgi:ceramide glucosyltransferase